MLLYYFHSGAPTEERVGTSLVILSCLSWSSGFWLPIDNSSMDQLCFFPLPNHYMGLQETSEGLTCPLKVYISDHALTSSWQCLPDLWMQTVGAWCMHAWHMVFEGTVNGAGQSPMLSSVWFIITTLAGMLTLKYEVREILTVVDPLKVR